ncbi:MAG: hypothetical protein LBH00_11845 [Planctomycetaceae bacterium]|jgi:ribonuclease HII|nr:hypothetical protein [Planctomycetaceae bacterium]
MLIFGTDEAGYGPNLGPLVVSLTAWEAEPADFLPLAEDLQQNRILIGDSKKVYHSGGSLIPLETGVLVPMRFLNQQDSPVAAGEEQIRHLVPKLTSILHKRNVRLSGMHYRSIEPAEFNRMLDRFGSKGSLLSDTTLRLITEQIARITSDSPILVLCDKHGGRNHYLDLLTAFFPGAFIRIIQESRESSVYRILNGINGSRQIEFRFLAKGESQLPVALASMLSKYRRELAMIRFNEFWRRHLPHIRPTAGYPEDAGRFRQEIAAVQKQLGIPDCEIWRNR